MNKEKLNNIWKIMKSCRLEFNNCHSDILCTICKNVLINAHSGPCGCRYCLECVTKYLDAEGNICPGNTDYCTDDLLNMNLNIHADQSINRIILETIVKCPQKNCEFKDKLIKLEDHVRICDSQSLECPYLNIGCKDYNSMNVDMKNHMLEEIVSHSKLLFEYIDNLKNEIKVIKEENFVLDNNNKDLMKCFHDLKSEIENDNQEMKEKLEKIVKKSDEKEDNLIKMKKELKMLNEEILSLKMNVSENKKCFDDSKLKLENVNREGREHLMEIKKAFVEEQKNIEKLKRENKKLNDERELIKRDISEDKRGTLAKIDEINKLITDLKWISNESDKSISNVMNQMKVLQMIQEQGNCGGIVWRIGKWKEKTELARANIQTYVDSDSFFSHINGYELCLSVGPNGDGRGRGTFLSIWCYAKQNECNENLSWPFQYDITLELINQHTTESHITYTLRYDDRYLRPPDVFYQRDNLKPENDSFRICYHNKFITLQELSNNPSLVDNDQIVIRCIVTIND